ncbi:Fe-S cluster assembly protein SufD [Lottiidibacillus patelloidae]|uniref:Fe-S cluster assembly protein SufD n=1 Tax=Lottiidibacillus patelloidae TaxID=2670334 RepID=A0A263BQX4_9BACI|nr:Fe-S cluster assembly protein SufD [Lottiidibacillus patelloidae]OZM55978.1 Fe-S cluster assembly protein SufD [Lottiidibacillus patelloidae]
MSLDTKNQYDAAYVSELSKKNNEPSWLTDLRDRGIQGAETLPLPKPEKTKIDNWNFTQFNHDIKSATVSSLSELPTDIQGLIGEENESTNVLVHRDTTLSYSNVSKTIQDKGVIFTSLAEAVQNHGELVQKYLMDGVKVDENKLTALHAALMNGGTFLYVPKNVEVDVPLQAIYSIETDGAGLFNHVIIVAEANSSVTYIENYTSNADTSAVANIIAEVYAGDNARVLFGAVDTFGKDVTALIYRRGIVSRDGRIEWALGQMNDGNTISDNTIHLHGDGSHTDTKTVTVGRGEQKQNFTSQVFHYGKNSDSNILNHGVMKDSASSIYNGITKIEHGAQKANGEQTQRVLMLSEKARGDANPILLIDEDDVTAGHAASVGRVDEMQLYYLMSRGISKNDAERLIIRGFLAPVVKELAIDSVRERLVEVIERKVK